MPEKISPIASSLITLLHNINELVSISNKRREARDVMSALCIYARNSKFIFSQETQEKIERFNSALLDSRPNTITHMVQDISHDILKADSRNKE